MSTQASSSGSCTAVFSTSWMTIPDGFVRVSHAAGKPLHWGSPQKWIPVRCLGPLMRSTRTTSWKSSWPLSRDTTARPLSSLPEVLDLLENLHHVIRSLYAPQVFHLLTVNYHFSAALVHR